MKTIVKIAHFAVSLGAFVFTALVVLSLPSKIPELTIRIGSQALAWAFGVGFVSGVGFVTWFVLKGRLWAASTITAMLYVILLQYRMGWPRRLLCVVCTAGLIGMVVGKIRESRIASNQASEATSEPAPGADSSSHQG